MDFHGYDSSKILRILIRKSEFSGHAKKKRDHVICIPNGSLDEAMITLTEKMRTSRPTWARTCLNGWKRKESPLTSASPLKRFFLCWWRRIAGSDTTKMMAIEENEITNAFCVINCRVAQSTWSYIMMALRNNRRLHTRNIKQIERLQTEWVSNNIDENNPK